MSKTLLSGGLIAGALAGVVVALLQLWLIQPLIIEAVALPLNRVILNLCVTV